MRLRTATTVGAALAVTAGLLAPASAMAASARPVTLAQLQSATVPSLCGHPAGRLSHGRLPGIPATAGKVVLAATPTHHNAGTLAVGDLNGDGVADAAAVVLCTSGGATRSASIQLYTSGGAWVGGLDLAKYTHRPDDVVAKLVVAHRKVSVRWTANQRGDAAGHPTLDYIATLALSHHRVVPSHVVSYKDFLVAQTVTGEALRGQRVPQATAHVAAQLRAAAVKGTLTNLFTHCNGSPLRDHTWGQAIDAFASSLNYAPWLRTNGRYCVTYTDDEKYWDVVRLQHVGWRVWRADYFAQART